MLSRRRADISACSGVLRVVQCWRCPKVPLVISQSPGYDRSAMRVSSICHADTQALHNKQGESTM